MPSKKAVIVGLTNTGKSQIFNNLTGEYAIVANYPGTTIEMRRAKTVISSQSYEIIDTPGLHCLCIHSEEEIVVRNMILEEQPDVIIQCINVVHLNQSLKLTVDLLELEVPMLIALNFVEEASCNGIFVDSKKLAQFLGIPVVEVMESCGKDREELKYAIASATKGTVSIHYGYSIESSITELAVLLPFELGFKHKIAFLLLLKDNYLEKYLAEKFGQEITHPLFNEANSLRRKFKNNIHQLINNQRSLWVDKVISLVVRKQKTILRGFSQQIAHACRHPVLGMFILALLMIIVYLSVTYISGSLDKLLNFTIVQPTTSFVMLLKLPQFWYDFLIGNHGILTLGFFNALCTVLPILSVFFFIFALFEDSGYISNFCIFSKRLFEKIGVTGKAIVPLVLGLGCKSMATLSTKNLSSYKEKFIAIFLIAFAVPCSAQLGINMAILAKVGTAAFLIAFGTLAFLELGAGLILNYAIKEDVDSCFIQNIAPMRLPNLKAVWIKTYYRVVMFLKEAIPLFIISAVVLFIFDKTGILNIIKQLLNPLMVRWLGLPRDIVDVFILAFARREAAAGLIFKMVDQGGLNYIQSIVAVVVTTTFFPCFTNVIAIGKEMGAKTAVMMTSLICVSSLILAGGLRWALVSVYGS